MNLPFDYRTAAITSEESVETGLVLAADGGSAKTGQVTATVTTAHPADQPTSPAEKNRKFLESVLAWPDANGPGWINLHVNRRNKTAKKTGEPWMSGWPYKDINEFIKRAVWIDNTEDMFNVWMCMSQQSESGTNTNGKPKAIRLAKNATWLKSIWVDCDIKDGPEHYGTLD